MRIIFIILTLLYLFFGVNPVFAVTFNISNPQQNSEEVTIDVSLSGLTSTSCPNTSCYLQAAFTPSTTNPRYFGFTKNNNEQWYEYIGSPEQSYIQSTFFKFQPEGGTWSGQLNLKINSENSNYNGPGTYYIKAWRYSGNSSSGASGYTSFLTANIQGSTSTPSPTPSPTPTPTPTPTPQPTPKKSSISIPSPTSSPKPSPIPATATTPTPTTIPTASPSKLLSAKSAVAGISKAATPSSASASSPSPNIKIANQKQINPFVLVGIIFIIAGVGSLGYLILRKNETIYNYFRRRN